MARSKTTSQPGPSPNPQGRPSGTGRVAQLRIQLEQHLPAIFSTLVTKAKDGDTSAIKLILERVIPPPKAQATPVAFPAPGNSLCEQGAAVIQAIGAGQLSPEQGTQVLSALASQAKLIELDELERRVAALEGKP